MCCVVLSHCKTTEGHENDIFKLFEADDDIFNRYLSDTGSGKREMTLCLNNCLGGPFQRIMRRGGAIQPLHWNDSPVKNYKHIVYEFERTALYVKASDEQNLGNNGRKSAMAIIFDFQPVENTN